MESREVVVIGGGPAGSTTASLLAARGHDVLLLDKARFPRDKACSEYASPCSLDVFDALGVRPQYEVAGPVRLLGMDIHSPGGRSFRVEYPAAGGPRYALAMPRWQLDPLLLNHARSLGVEVREGLRTRGLMLEGAAARGVVVQSHDGGEVRIGARLVVGADGLHSVAGRDLGVRREVRWPRRLGLVGHYSGVEGLQEHGEMHVARRGYCGIAPLSGGLASVGMALDLRRYRGRERSRDAMFREALEMFPGIRSKLRNARLVKPVSGVGPIARRVSRTEGEGWALVGDAAGYLDPFTGEGIYRALKGGELLAGVASAALKNGGPSARSLAPYGIARQEQFRYKSLVVLAVQAFVSYPALLEYATPRMLDRPAVRALFSSVLGDYADPRRVLHPRFVFELLRP